MSNLIIATGDQLSFTPMFGQRIVNILVPRIINGSGSMTLSRRKVCIQGDEKKIQLQAQYQLPGYSPGMGMVSIAQLAPDQLALLCKSKAPLIVKGSQFIARFTPTVPAVNTATGTPDTLPPTMGQGWFMPQQFYATTG